MAECKICGKEIPEYGEYCASCWGIFVVEKRKEERKQRFISWRDFRGFHGSPLAWVVLVLICLMVISSILSFKSSDCCEYVNRDGEIKSLQEDRVMWRYLEDLQGVGLGLAFFFLFLFPLFACLQLKGWKESLKVCLAFLLFVFLPFVSLAIIVLIMIFNKSSEILSSYRIVHFGIGWYSLVSIYILFILFLFFWFLELVYMTVVSLKADRKKAETT